MYVKGYARQYGITDSNNNKKFFPQIIRIGTINFHVGLLYEVILY